MDDVGPHAVEHLAERLRDRGIVELAARVPDVEQAVRPVEDADQPDAVLLPLADGVGAGARQRLHGRVEDGHVPAAGGQGTAREARHDGAAARVVEAERREHDAPAAARGDRRGLLGRLRRAARPPGWADPRAGEPLGQHEARASLGHRLRQRVPVHVGREVAQRVAAERAADGLLDLLELAVALRLVAVVGAVPAQAHDRAAADVAEREGRGGAQPEVDVARDRQRRLVATARVVGGAVHRGGRRDDVVAAEEQHVEQRPAAELAGRPGARLAAVGVDDDRVAVRDAGVGMRVEHGHRARQPVGQADVVVAELGDDLAARVLDQRVVRRHQADVGVEPHDAQARRGEPVEHLLRGGARAVVDHDDLVVVVRLLEAAGQRLRQVGGPVIGREPDRHPRHRTRHRLAAPRA